MQIIRQMSDLGPALRPWREAGQSIALVPTMGALHQGHLDLVTASRRVADRVIATIFVNPLQFNDSTDLDRYPRTEKGDCEKLRASGCDAVWIGAASDLYPDGFATKIRVAGVSERWEGALNEGNSNRDIKKAAESWIAENQQQFDDWVAQAAAAAK